MLYTYFYAFMTYLAFLIFSTFLGYAVRLQIFSDCHKSPKNFSNIFAKTKQNKTQKKTLHESGPIDCD